MKILCIDFGLCNFHNLISLVEDGHEVHLASGFGDLPVEYYRSLGVGVIFSDRDSIINEWVELNKPDIVLSTAPQIPSGRFASVTEVLGLTRRSNQLELNKLKTRNNVMGLGIKVPERLKGKDIIAPCVVKPDICGQTRDTVNICLTQKQLDRVGHQNCYVEEYIEGAIETNVAYVIAKGKWSILHTQEIIGEDVAKVAGNFTHWTRTSSFKNLSPENNEIVLKWAKRYLDWAAKECSQSSYVGQITGLLKDGVWYFCENNVRPEQTNSLPFFVSGNEFIEAMRGKPEILGEAFPNDVQKIIVMPVEEYSPYPFHLHEKHNVSVPCGLDLVDGVYRVADTFKARSSDRRIGIVICDRVIPQEFVDDILSDGNFTITARLV
jgi:hypothetical protein